MEEQYMHVYTVLRPFTAIVVFSAILLHSPCVSAGQETADWDEAQREATVMLTQQGTSIAELAADVSTVAPENAQDAMFKLCVLMRAGMNKESIEALHELKALSPKLGNRQISSIYYDACSDDLAWDVAKATVEVFAENIASIELDYRLLRHFLESGWTVEEVDKWLAAMPTKTQNFWVKARLRFNIKHGQGEVLLIEISNSVRENSQDIERVDAFLDALAYAGVKGEDKIDLSWMAETIRPKLATEARRIASGLKSLYQWTVATGFYQQAIDIPLTEEESEKLGMTVAIFVPTEKSNAMFAAHAREGMAECLLILGKKEQAQRWMVEAADIREKHNLGTNALFAGQVQAASGQRIIEGRIKEKEKESENDPQYWRDRAQYYRGRNESALEEEAILKGFTLTESQPLERFESGGYIDWRTRFLNDYARFLEREKRIDDGVALLRREIEHSPPTSESAERAAYFLAGDFDKGISADDTLLWNWLESRPKWEHTEKSLLLRLLEKAGRDDRDRYFRRAEEFVIGNDPSRASSLGWIMNRMRFPKRSIPLLKYAIENAQDEKLIERTYFTLLESYLDAGDWKHAEEVFPQAAKRMTAREFPEWYSRMAVAAAKAGARTDAMRIWSRAANLSPSQLDGLEDLVEAGLRNELKNFYLKMQKEMPSSEVPAKALMALEKK